MLVSLPELLTVAVSFTPSEIYIKLLNRDPVVPAVKATTTFAIELTVVAVQLGSGINGTRS